MICLPIGNQLSDIIVVHEPTYIVHAETASIRNELGIEQGWLQSCHDYRALITQGITSYLSDERGEVIEKFTFGTGASGYK